MENFLFTTTGSRFSLIHIPVGVCSYHSCDTYLEFPLYSIGFCQETGSPLKLGNLQKPEGKDYVWRYEHMLWSVLLCNKPPQTLWHKLISVCYTHGFCGLRVRKAQKRMILFCSMSFIALAGKTQSWALTWWPELDSFEDAFPLMSTTWARSVEWSTYM